MVAVCEPEDTTVEHFTENTLWLIGDTSGSMAENGKAMLLRSLVRSVEQWLRLDYGRAALKLVAWNEKTQVLDWNPDHEVPDILLDCSGHASGQALLGLPVQETDKILLLTDGWWAKDTETHIKRWQRNLPEAAVRAIKIGADANDLFKGKNVFLPEDVFAMLDGWLPPTGETEAGE